MMGGLEVCRPAAPRSNLEALVDCDGVENVFARHLPATPTVMVKNTFIQSVVQDAQADDSEDELVVVRRSCPASHSHHEGSWERRVFCKAPLLACNEEACDSEDEMDSELSMRVLRTCSDFLQAVSREDHTDQGFAGSPSRVGDAFGCGVGEGRSSQADENL